MRPALPALLLAAIVAAPAAAFAQPTRTIYLIAAGDTISAERIRLRPGRFEDELLVRRAGQRIRFAATVSDAGLLTRLDAAYHLAADSAGAPARSAATLDFRADSVIIRTQSGASAVERRVASRAGVLPYLNPSFGLVELMIRRARILAADSVELPVFSLSGGQTVAFWVKSLRPDSVVVSLGGVQVRLAVDSAGGITGGWIPSQQIAIVVSDRADPTFFLGIAADYSAPPGAPYTAVEVTVPTPAGFTLAGTLTLPKGAKGPVPAVVTITGSGLEDRDEAIPLVKGYRPFREIADALGRRGIAVLRMDDRGFGGSGGSAATATSEDFAGDIRAGLAYLRTRPEIDGKRLGLAGHSEGGIIAPMIARTDSTLKAIVLMAGSAWTGRRIMEYQNREALEHQPQLSAGARDSILKTVVPQKLDSAIAAVPWLRFFATYDPVETARQVRTPVLILQGETDRQVPAEQAPELAAAFRAGGNRDVTLRLFPATNHLFLADPDGSPSGYPKLTTSRIRPEVLDTLVEWLVKRLR